ncbi:hypothetical protein A2631_05530 [Candidatus Daviesbacteria bacterium RIFCSPHIGHO2_01_FULL_44_29]|uniref:GIY-YIG domain-containing protein n=1 Tax=Candidatus Daviesbacteria bacterium RIFCSPHIGHO2_02_FULL_43_12 TaxID=1797776 RepID=A0A1F5KIC8_9BACT|nr:MAG: hypothetical protein A2631_05530 [Candidatus Daviesbacteria bacterium RIFCSPHIGHO2_01_FULL_44_29]OGE39208.1 MAG: hypothetical protein A3E86_01275 [Candidatus Daviesbacteria bacterium RIFCSPHIGHO2_12_FULL_47_45]OGE40589.1 MAG: hypothetical protein A3D25_00535 [Candidatus Daviesbacteria bacterium RIFCSPHIGHO2_02_FULL_43_12]OGE70149.1 MAG: hypothetical protein A3B55_00305 [Candidatus Daviesbacteria bacterium RIFCSPLOWO2_01_FULL_43_15]
MWFVYILLCQDSSLYTGVARDPEKRFLLHQSGIGAKYTRSHKPLRIIYQEQVASYSKALKREREIKNWSREDKIQNLSLIVKL